MNWVGGARKRICGTDLNSKSTKSQRKLQKEYFERRRHGVINAKRTDCTKEVKHPTSQDILILDFKNDNKQHNDGAVSNNKARAAFRVVNLSKKPASSKCPKSNTSRYERVVMPLSPVKKQSSLQLSHSPTSEEGGTGPTLSNEKQHSFDYLTSYKFDKNSLCAKQPKYKSSNNLQFLENAELENLPDLSVAASTSLSLIDLFGMTIKKPKKTDRSSLMPPPPYGVTGAKVKRKKLSVHNRGFLEFEKQKFSSESDYPSDDTTISHCSVAKQSVLQIPEQSQLTQIHRHYPKSNNRILTDFQIVPSQDSPMIMKERFNHVVHKPNEFETSPNLFKLFSPLRSSDFVSETETDFDVCGRNLSGGNDLFDMSKNFPNYENDLSMPCSKEYYSSDFQAYSNFFGRQKFSKSSGQIFLKETDANLIDKSFSTQSDIYPEENIFNPELSNLSECDENLNEDNKTIFQSSKSFDFSLRVKLEQDNTKHFNSLKCSEESSFCNSPSKFNSYFSYESSFRTKGNNDMLLEQQLTTGLHDVTREMSVYQKEIPTASVDNATSSIHEGNKQGFIADTNIQFFELLLAVNDKLMMDLETQLSERSSQKVEESTSKDLVETQCEMNDKAVVCELLCDLVSRVVADGNGFHKTIIHVRSQNQFHLPAIDKKMQSSIESSGSNKSGDNFQPENIKNKNRQPVNVNRNMKTESQENKTQNDLMPEKILPGNYKTKIFEGENSTIGYDLPQHLSHQSKKMKVVSQKFSDKNCISSDYEAACEGKLCGNKLESKTLSVSTQTFQKMFTDTACSPIIFQSDNVEKDVIFWEKRATPKVYSLRSRSRLCNDDDDDDSYLSKVEE